MHLLNSTGTAPHRSALCAGGTQPPRGREEAQARLAIDHEEGRGLACWVSTSPRPMAGGSGFFLPGGFSEELGGADHGSRRC